MWLDIQPQLKTHSFKAELDALIDALQNDGKNPPLSSRKNLQAFCNATPGKDLKERGIGFLVRTLNHSYYFRCLTGPSNYDICCFSYDNRRHLLALGEMNADGGSLNE
jgi:hypothetical protein